MSTANEGYVASIWPEFVKRRSRAAEAVKLLRQIIRVHADFDLSYEGDPLSLPSVEWNEDRPGEQAYVLLSKEGGTEIRPTDVQKPNPKELTVREADFTLLAPDDTAVVVATIETDPPRLRDYDGMPLNSEQIGKVIIDLAAYEAALAAQSL